MPRGFIITEWTEEEGLVLRNKYPEDIEVDLDDMMRTFYAHITGTGEEGNVVVRLKKSRSNVSSYFTGMESENPMMINTMLELSEAPEMFGEATINEINEKILYFIRAAGERPDEKFKLHEKLSNYLKNTMFHLDRMKNLSKEQRLAQIFTSKKGRAILKLLQERAMSRKDVQDRLEDILKEDIANMEGILDPFIKTGIVKQDWIEGFSDIYLFLLLDFMLLRKPAEKVIKKARKNRPTTELAQKYIEEVQHYFLKYKPTEEDSLTIALNMMNPDKYDLLALFREKPYPLSKVPKGPEQDLTQVKELIHVMEGDGILKIIKDKSGAEWVFLFTDISSDTFFPEYLVEQIRMDRNAQKLKKEVALKHLELLEKAYS